MESVRRRRSRLLRVVGGRKETMKRPTYYRPTDEEFEEQVERAAHGPTLAVVGWFIAECRRARAQETELRKQLRGTRGSRHL